MVKFSFNACIMVNEEQAKELREHIEGKTTSELFCSIAEDLGLVNDTLQEKFNISFNWDMIKEESNMNELEVFEKSANKSLEEIKAMQDELYYMENDNPEKSTKEEIYHQAIRSYFSRLLMNYTEENPLLDVWVLAETKEDVGMSDLEKTHIIGFSQTECEGYINILIEGEDEWSDIDIFDDDEQLGILENLLEEI